MSNTACSYRSPEEIEVLALGHSYFFHVEQLKFISATVQVLGELCEIGFNISFLK